MWGGEGGVGEEGEKGESIDIGTVRVTLHECHSCSVVALHAIKGYHIRDVLGACQVIYTDCDWPFILHSVFSYLLHSIRIFPPSIGVRYPVSLCVCPLYTTARAPPWRRACHSFAVAVIVVGMNANTHRTTS